MLFVVLVEVSFSLHSLEEIALDFKYCCPSPALPASSPEDVRKGVNLEGEESERNGSSEAETVIPYVEVVLFLLLMDLPVFCLDFFTVSLPY